MNQSKVFNKTEILQLKLSSYLTLVKLRLSLLVILSSIIGYIYGSSGSISIVRLALFTLGGLLVTFASNAINQYIERDSDKLMLRTQNRPLPTGKLSNIEAIIFVGISAISGILLLTYIINPLTGVLAAISMFLYGFFYTPLKKVSPIAVFIGAIPGALPPLLGYVAATNYLDTKAFWLFLVQFFWQFPHFWAIAWVSFDDYLRANIMLLPSHTGKTKHSTIIILFYTFILVPLSLVPLYFGGISKVSVAIIFISSVLFLYQAFRLHKYCNDKEAKKLMFYSFAYLLIFLFSILF